MVDTMPVTAGEQDEVTALRARVAQLERDLALHEAAWEERYAEAQRVTARQLTECRAWKASADDSDARDRKGPWPAYLTNMGRLGLAADLRTAGDVLTSLLLLRVVVAGDADDLDAEVRAMFTRRMFDRMGL